MKSPKLAGRVAVVTGAASGIGRALAVSLAARHCHLALADIDEDGLAETQRLLESRGLEGCGIHESRSAQGIEVSLHRLDVADRNAVAAFPAAVAQRHGRVDLLFNNAGVAVGGDFEEIGDADFRWLFDINFWGVVRMTRAFLPLLRASDAARIVNVSSLFGLISPPGHSAYCASKFAVRGFSNALRFELEGSTVAVTVVHPGGVATSIARSARAPAGSSPEDVAAAIAQAETVLRMPAARAADIIVRGVINGKPRILVGMDVKLAALIERVMPVSYWRLLRRAMP